MGPTKEQLLEMIENREFVEMPICPKCGEITHAGGEFYPCCGEENDEAPKEWVRLIPIDLYKEGESRPLRVR